MAVIPLYRVPENLLIFGRAEAYIAFNPRADSMRLCCRTRKPNADDMAIIQNATPFDSVKKKFSGSDEIHFRNRKKDNATIGVRVKHPYDGGNSEAQLAVRNAFKAAQAQVKTILADPEQRATYEAKFKAQKKYITLRGYVVAQVFAKQ